MNIKDLIEKCINGSGKAQRILLNRFYSYGYNLSRRYSSNAEDANEILSNAFKRVFKKLNLYNPEKPFEKWFARLIVHASSDFYRNSKSPNQYIGNFEDVIQNTDPNIIDMLSYKELLEAITSLSPQYRSVFNLFVIDGFKHLEIAEIMKISVGTSKSNLN